MDKETLQFENQDSIDASEYAPPQYSEEPPIPSDKCPLINQQPKPLPTIQKVLKPKRKDYYDLSLFLILIWLISFSPHLLCCSIPALYFAHKGRKYYAAGDEAAGEKNMKTALVCNLFAIVVAFAGWIFINLIGPALGGIIPAIIRAAHRNHAMP